MSDDWQPKETVDSVERAAGIISALKHLKGAGITELAEYLDMSKSGVHKQLSTLVKTGFVTKQQKEYKLSYQFLLLGEYVKTNSKLYQIGASEVDKLANQSGYFAYLAAIGESSAYCIHTAEGTDAVVPNLSVGKKISLYSSAAGKAILAELPERKQDRILTESILPQTNKTVTDSDELRAEFNTIQEQGVAFEDEENVPGMRAVGAPILSEEGTVVGAVAVSGPLSLLADDHYEEELPSLVKQTKNFIEVKFSLESRDPLEEGSHIPKDFY